MCELPHADSTGQKPRGTRQRRQALPCGHGDDGLGELEIAGRAQEGGVAEGEDAAVGGDEPVALAGGRGGHGDDGLGQLEVAGGAKELGVAEGEDAAVGREQPVALARGPGRHGDDGLVQLEVTGGALEAGGAEGEDAAVGGDQTVALARGHRSGNPGYGAASRSGVRAGTLTGSGTWTRAGS